MSLSLSFSASLSSPLSFSLSMSIAVLLLPPPPRCHDHYSPIWWYGSGPFSKEDLVGDAFCSRPYGNKTILCIIVIGPLDITARPTGVQSLPWSMQLLVFSPLCLCSASLLSGECVFSLWFPSFAILKKTRFALREWQQSCHFPWSSENHQQVFHFSSWPFMHRQGAHWRAVGRLWLRAQFSDLNTGLTLYLYLEL